MTINTQAIDTQAIDTQAIDTQAIDHQLMRKIPKVDTLLDLATTPALDAIPRVYLVEAIRSVLDELRENIKTKTLKAIPSTAELLAQITHASQTAARFSLRKVINATGVVIHTNLGRCILGTEVASHLSEIASSYSTLEYNPATGTRGSRHDHVEKLLIRLTGCEAALVVNNNAAAVFLILSALAKGRELIVSRGELVEIGGSFRIPDIMEAGGALLKEVGTTNRTSLADYEHNIVPGLTAGILKVHTSNFRIIGYTTSVPMPDLAELSQKHNIPLICDLGSGTFFNLQPLGIPDEPTINQALTAGADLVSFSGDKMLGGAQSGLIIGSKKYVDILKRHPLVRALRVDKMTLAALEAVLTLYLTPEKAKEKIPTLAMLFTKPEELRNKAEALLELLAGSPGLKAEVVPTESQVGGGSAPERPLPSWAVSLEVMGLSPDLLEEQLRLNDTPIITRIYKGQVLLDLRTIAPEEFTIIRQALNQVPIPLGTSPLAPKDSADIAS